MMKKPKRPIISDYEQVTPVKPEGTKDMVLRWLVARHPDSYIESPTFQFRVFDIYPYGNTSHHIHAWEHVFFVVKGCGHLKTGIGDFPYRKNQFAFVPPYLDHQFFAGKCSLRMICVIPNPQEGKSLIPLSEEDWGILFKLREAIKNEDMEEIGRITNILYNLSPEIRTFHAMILEGMKERALQEMYEFIEEVTIPEKRRF